MCLHEPVNIKFAGIWTSHRHVMGRFTKKAKLNRTHCGYFAYLNSAAFSWTYLGLTKSALSLRNSLLHFSLTIRAYTPLGKQA